MSFAQMQHVYLHFVSEDRSSLSVGEFEPEDLGLNLDTSEQEM